jgi:hypothetical protein
VLLIVRESLLPRHVFDPLVSRVPNAPRHLHGNTDT